MESQVARVIPWGGKTQAEQPGPAQACPTLGPIDGLLIVMSDEQLDALAATFLMSPVRKAMTFEAYLAARGFAREVE